VRVLVEVGDRVTPGMTVAILDDADQGLALAQAQAELAQDKSELARLEVGTGVKSLSASSRTTFSLCGKGSRG